MVTVEVRKILLDVHGLVQDNLMLLLVYSFLKLVSRSLRILHPLRSYVPFLLHHYECVSFSEHFVIEDQEYGILIEVHL